MRKITSLFISILICGTFSCCEVSTSDNGDLDGNWQLLSVCYTQNGNDAGYLVNRKADNVFFAVQFGLLEIKTQGGLQLTNNASQFFGHFKQNGDSLLLPALYIHLDVENDSLPAANTQLFEPLGIRGNSARFAIQQLNRSSMTLQSDFARLTFRKF